MYNSKCVSSAWSAIVSDYRPSRLGTETVHASAPTICAFNYLLYVLPKFDQGTSLYLNPNDELLTILHYYWRPIYLHFSSYFYLLIKYCRMSSNSRLKLEILSYKNQNNKSGKTRANSKAVFTRHLSLLITPLLNILIPQIRHDAPSKSILIIPWIHTARSLNFVNNFKRLNPISFHNNVTVYLLCRLLLWCRLR